MARYVLGSNFHDADLSGAARIWTETDTRSFPPAVTLGFRGVFWNVFTAVYEFDLKALPVQIYNRPWRIVKVMALESGNATTRLGFTDPRNVFVVFILETVDTEADVDLNHEMFTRAGTSIGIEQQFVKEALNNISPLLPETLIPSLRHNRDLPARFIFQLEEDVDEPVLITALVAFYFYALLMLWQLEREQVHQPLDTPDDALGSATKMLLRQRQKIINVTRLFFTTNITNYPEAQRIRKQVMTRFGLERRFSRLPPINDSIERYYEIRTQVLLQRQSEQLNRIAMVIALLGLPISVISMLFAINTQAEILHEPIAILSKPEVRTFLVVSALLCLMALLALVLTLTLRLGPIARALFGRDQKNTNPFGSRPSAAALNSIDKNNPPAT